MTAPYITRRSIHAEEEVLDEYATQLDGTHAPSYSWTADLDGYLSSGEHVQMTRSGSTFAEAVAALEAAITENG